jgi:hypothetical protein
MRLKWERWKAPVLGAVAGGLTAIYAIIESRGEPLRALVEPAVPLAISVTLLAFIAATRSRQQADSTEPLEEKARRAGDALKDAAAIVADLQHSIGDRQAALEEAVRALEETQKLASLSEPQAAAVRSSLEETLREQHRRNSRSTWVQTAAQTLAGTLLGFVLARLFGQGGTT